MSERNDRGAVRGNRANSARVYDYILGGKDHYAVDRETAEASLRAWPGLRASMLANRATMRRMAHWLTAEAGIRQFLDIGTGIPTEPNLHQVVQRQAPESRIVYVDNDPIVLAHADALMRSTPEGRTAYIQADMTTPGSLLTEPALRETLDLNEPVALTVIAMLQFVKDAQGLVETLMEPLAPGSYLALTLATGDLAPESGALAREYTQQGIPMYLRTRAEVDALFAGLDLVEPGVTPMTSWRPADGDTSPVAATNMYAGVARKP
ncbi:SAM-dependent methyltransferase [Streptomyces sp. NBC_00859]|uniref:SAM-dependent methyltransferase n=1 Tax=Streptomyces sp. NBC_00859 TaxID=2903682 RepID=UPI00386593E9|nr:SAM-dependent methyltransferase [Streptomyces sp. NBC_00859]